jgi:hypothetical protein
VNGPGRFWYVVGYLIGSAVVTRRRLDRHREQHPVGQHEQPEGSPR